MDENFMRIGRILMLLTGMVMIITNLLWLLIEINRKSLAALIPVVFFIFFAYQISKMIHWIYRNKTI